LRIVKIKYWFNVFLFFLFARIEKNYGYEEEIDKILFPKETGLPKRPLSRIPII